MTRAPIAIRVGSKIAADEVLRLCGLARQIDGLSNEKGLSLDGSITLRRVAKELREKAYKMGIPIMPPEEPEDVLVVIGEPPE